MNLVSHIAVTSCFNSKVNYGPQKSNYLTVLESMKVKTAKQKALQQKLGDEYAVELTKKSSMDGTFYYHPKKGIKFQPTII
jgi:hypothetical protein